MFLSRRPCVGLPIAIAAAMGVAASIGLLAPTADAFYIQNHERVTRDALTPRGRQCGNRPNTRRPTAGGRRCRK
jgi:hypothetical protein